MNDEVVHGIPSESRRLEAGDIIGIDVGVLMDGYHADAARTFAVGPVSEETRHLLSVTRSALEAGITAPSREPAWVTSGGHSGGGRNGRVLDRS